jgi:hypothetical protein
MASFFKKALGLFVEFEEDPNKPSQGTAHTSTTVRTAATPGLSSEPVRVAMTQADLDKFEKHFEKLFDQANLPGPDYFEFWKMMETLEAHIPDEKARISAVFASLSIQGLTKSRLVESATHYKGLLERDKAEFDRAFSQKATAELEGRKKNITELEKKIVANSELIQKLTREITEAQGVIATLKSEIVQEEQKLLANKGGYTVACDAMMKHITDDIQKIQTTL